MKLIKSLKIYRPLKYKFYKDRLGKEEILFIVEKELGNSDSLIKGRIISILNHYLVNYDYSYSIKNI